MEKRNSVALRALLLRYLALCVAAIAVVVAGFLLLFSLALRSGFVLPANTAEQQVMQARDALEQRGAFDAALVPRLCAYAVFDEAGAVQQTGMDNRELRAAQAYFTTGQNTEGLFHVAARLQSGVCVLQYDFSVQYKTPALNGLLPDFQVLVPLLSVVAALFSLGGLTFHYTRRLRRSLQPLTAAAQAMTRGNLEWSAVSTGVKEYDDVLHAMQTMQTALRQSLQTQWDLEHSRTAQTQALAHDLRTPLTVIAGNAQLLEETPLTPEQTQCVAAILHGSDAAESYVASLRSLAHAQPPHLQGEVVDGAAFFEQLLCDAQELCKIHGVLCETQLRVAPADVNPADARALPQLRVRAQEIRRAVANLVQNAAEHTPRGGTVSICLAWQAPQCTVRVQDSGAGFSPQALVHATQPLYTENASRTPDGHVGLGLAVAQQTAQAHGGAVQVENTADGHGLVTMTMALGYGESEI